MLGRSVLVGKSLTSGKMSVEFHIKQMTGTLFIGVMQVQGP
jgi:hypothetical protein